MSARADVLFYVQHLLGTGHLHRAAAIARAAARAGLRVVVASGGLPVPGLDAGGARLVQLDPVRARDETFSVLVDRRGEPIDHAFKAARRARLCALYAELRPKILLIEMFPFGRRQMRFELIPLLRRARAERPRPRIVCSLRDVLTAPRRPDKADWMLRTCAALFDRVLVHGDPDVLPLERSFPRAVEIADRLRYTGYVVGDIPAPPGPREAGEGEVLVSAGGGAVAKPLIEAALGARALGAVRDAPWRVLIGANLPEARFRALARGAPAGVMVERARPDFRHLLARARLSISQGGYNTVIEALAAGTPALVVPFAAPGETEQSLRARVLAERGALSVLEAADLAPETLAAAAAAALARAATGAPGARPNMDGAAETARVLRDMAAIVP